MAATERRIRRAARRLPLLAAGVGALAARGAFAQSSVDTKLLWYRESDGRTEVVNPSLFWTHDLGEKGTVGLLLGYDTITGASPSGAYPAASTDTTTSASGTSTSTSSNIPMAAYRDRRESAALSYARRFGAHLPSVDLSYSHENDYQARAIGLADAWTMAGGRGTLHFGLSLSRDRVEPVTGGSAGGAKRSDNLALGWTWVLTERDLLDVSASYMRNGGVLNDPYKVVPVGAPEDGTVVHETRPDTRARKALLVKYGHSFDWDAALKLTYRFYWDDWSIRAHTVEASYDQKIGDDWMVCPRIRLYTQSAASFYGASFDTAQEYMSADYRLSAFDSWLVGVGTSYRINETFSVNLAVTYQKQTGRDGVAPVSLDGSDVSWARVSAADLTTTTATVGFTWRY